MTGNPFHSELEAQFRSREVVVTDGPDTYTGRVQMWNYNELAVLLTDATKNGEEPVGEVLVTDPGTVERVEQEMTTKAVNPTDCRPLKYNQRVYDTADFREFVRTLRERQRLSNFPVVRPVNEEAESYEIVSGHKRAEAAKQAGLEEIVVEVEDLTEWDAVEIFVDEHFPLSDGEFDAATAEASSGWYDQEEVQTVLDQL